MASFKDWFIEDEDDIFMGSPKSKFFDVSKEASQDIVQEEWDKIIEKLAILEMIVSKDKGEDFDLEKTIKEFKYENEKEVNSMKKGLYVEFTGEIISRLDS